MIVSVRSSQTAVETAMAEIHESWQLMKPTELARPVFVLCIAKDAKSCGQ